MCSVIELVSSRASHMTITIEVHYRAQSRGKSIVREDTNGYKQGKGKKKPSRRRQSTHFHCLCILKLRLVTIYLR
ncbi:hypothetical protein ACSBR2_001654 [Camellia fascicularis]